jgi:beta-N-acetylhexosaminidase
VVSRDLDRQIARLFCVGFAERRVDPSLCELLELGVGGVVLFSRNVGEPGEVASLVGELRRRAGRPLLRAVDQEGGRVARLREGFTQLPSMRALGEVNDADLAEAVGRVLGRELAAVGLNFNLAPVLDLATNGDSTVIADRSLGTDPGLVARLGARLVRGIQSAGVAACGKHFPGHGDTPLDSHHDLPFLKVDRATLDARELPPFVAAIEAGVAALMPGHLVVEAVDPTRPATMSRPLIDGLLRRRLGFDGLVVSDDLEMEAITKHNSVAECTIEAVNAGVDLLIVAHRHELVHESIAAIREAVQRGRIDLERILDAGRRIERVAASRDPAIDLDRWERVVGCDDHRRVADTLRRRWGKPETVVGVDPTAAWTPNARAGHAARQTTA